MPSPSSSAIPDNNGNGKHDADEPVIAASDSRAVIYTKT